VNIDLTDVENPCLSDEHHWKFDSGDDSVGINSGWICIRCGALNDDPAPDYYDYDWGEAP
jgi:hypothetical protein